jgi:hypothetical protein
MAMGLEKVVALEAEQIHPIAKALADARRLELLRQIGTSRHRANALTSRTPPQ